MPEAEPQPQPIHLPVATPEITNRLLKTLQIDLPGEKRRYTTAGEKGFLGNNLASLVTDVFADVMSSNRKFPEHINSILNERMSIQEAENALRGMAVVIKVFNEMQEFDLVPRLGKLQPVDIDLAKQTLEQCIPSKDESQSMTSLQRLLKLPRIPEQQVSLNECLRKIKFDLMTARGLDVGANAMYKTLEVLWPRLYPPQAPTQTPLQQPTI